MTSRIPNYLPVRRQTAQPSQSVIQELRNSAQKQIGQRIRQVETFIQEHPATGIGAAFCIGILLGWFIKRR
jgi:ElaB/YqjD/DUF883 family membrane-anchored ribosome-binding protein